MDNVCVLGDSVLLGITYDDEKGRYSLLRDGALTAFTRTLGFRVSNLSRMGQTSLEAAARFRASLSSGEPPDAVVVELGGNDCNMPWEEIAANPSAAHKPAVSMDSFRLTLKDIIQTAIGHGIKPIVCTLPPLVPSKFFDWVARDASAKRNIMSYLGGTDRIYRWQEAYSLEAAVIAAEESAGLLDIRGSFLAVGNYQDLICSDGMHPNSDGHLLMRRALLTHFQGIL